jgi:hypothetical protein
MTLPDLLCRDRQKGSSTLSYDIQITGSGGSNGGLGTESAQRQNVSNERSVSRQQDRHLAYVTYGIALSAPMAKHEDS